MTINQIWRIIIAFSAVLLVSCGGSGDGETDPVTQSDPLTRGFFMGFTPWPYEATTTATEFVYSELAARSDIIAHHLDGGIPWQEALDNTAYPAAVEAELSGRTSRAVPGQRVYLAVSPFNGARDDMAGYWGTGTNQPLPPAWAARDFDSTEVIQAYTNFARDLITRFDADYFNLGIEASELAINDLAQYDRYVAFAEEVSTALHQDFPNLKLMISIGLKSPGSVSAAVINAELPRLVQYIDVVGASVYPFVFFDHADKGDPQNLPVDWLSQLQAVANGKPIAVAETGWIAERLEIPAYSVDVIADTSDQMAYLEELFEHSETLNAEFVIWFFLVDFDALWLAELNQDPVARIWRDTGLYDQGLNPRPALDAWQGQLSKALQ